MIVFTKFVMFIDILKILFGFASWPIFDSYLPVTHAYFHFKDSNLSEYQKTFTKQPNLVCALILWRSCIGLLNGQILYIFIVLSTAMVWRLIIVSHSDCFSEWRRIHRISSRVNK